LWAATARFVGFGDKTGKQGRSRNRKGPLFPQGKHLHNDPLMANAGTMIRRSIASAAKGLVLAVVLSLLLCGNRIAGSANFAGNCAREMIVIFRDSDTQWMVFLCLLVYFVTFLFLRSHD